MDGLHERDDWPFVKQDSNVKEPVSPQNAGEAVTGWSDSSDEGEDERGLAQIRGHENGNAFTMGLDDISPMLSSRSSFEEINIPSEAADEERDLSQEEGASQTRSSSDELYEDSDEDREMLPSTKPHGNARDSLAHSITSRSQARSSTSTIVPSAHIRPNSMIKRTSSKTLPRRTPSITAQIPLNRQRVRYSWQSMPDEEPARPRIHVIKLVSNTATASAGFPQGEAFGFSISPCGRRIAAYNSARLYILQSQALPVGISQDYALRRRPLAVEIVDEGNTLGILADAHTVNLYDLEHQLLRRIKTIKLDYPTHCIAMSTTGALLAAAYEGGVEIFSLAPSALPTDRRAVRSQKMDRLTFSKDGSTLIGTTTRINASSTLVMSVPVFPSAPSGVPSHEELKEAWCSELLAPENIRNSSHANFMRENRETCNDRLFAWNGLQDTFGVLKIPDMMYSNLDFPVVIDPPLSTLGGLGAAIHSCPDVDEYGDTVAMIVNDRTIRLYLVPKDVANNGAIVEAHSIDHELDEGYGCPFSDVRWVQSGTDSHAPGESDAKQVRGRLIVTSPGAVMGIDLSDEMFDVEDTEGGRIIMFDFDPQYAGQPGQTFSLTLGNSPPQKLEEPDLDVAHEIAIVRRRTVNQNKTGTLSQKPVTLGRSATSSGNRVEKVPRAGAPAVTPGGIRRSMILSPPEAIRALPNLQEANESSEGAPPIDEPYTQGAPRSQASMQRAASNAQRHRFQTLEEKVQEGASVDSGSNFLPLPEYTEEPNAPLPSRFRVMAGLEPRGNIPPSKPAVVTTANRSQASPAPSARSGAAALAADLSAARQPRPESRVASPLPLPSRDTPSRDGGRTPTPGNPGPAVSFETAIAPVIADVQPHVARSETFDSLRPMNPRFLERAYANAVLGPRVISAAPSAQNPGTNSYAVAERPSQSQTSLTNGRVQHGFGFGLDTTRPQILWDAVSPLPPSSQSSPALSHPPVNGLSYRFSTSHWTGNPSPIRPVNASPTRAPSSAGSLAPSTISAVSYSGRDASLPPHIQAFRHAAAANAAASVYPSSQSATHIPHRTTSKSSTANGYTITAWHAPAASSVPAGHVRRPSVSSRSAFASTTKAKNLGFFRRKKQPDLLFGPEFASKQPGAEGSRPGTAQSGDEGGGAGAKSVMDAKSMFTVRTRMGTTKCALM